MFANPWGALALLGVPVVLVIHMFKVRPNPHRISTLFLFEHVQTKAEAGRRMDRVTNSLVLWLQLLAVLLLTWLLVQPRFLLEDTRQRVAFVIDASASMSAFEDEAWAAVDRTSAKLGANAAVTEWVLSESSGRVGRLYRGEDRAALLAALRSSKSQEGTHDVTDALSLARRVVAGLGVTVFVTDHVVDVPPGVVLLAVGTPKDGVGFTGLRVTDSASGTAWSTTVKNHGDTPATRQWWIAEASDTKTTLELGPRELRVIRGTMPDGATSMTLALQGDAFAADDRLTIVRPTTKPLSVDVSAGAAGLDMVKRLLVAVGADQTTPGRVSIATRRRDATIDPGPSIVWLDAPSRAVRKAQVGAFDVGHALAEGLSWRGLSYRPDKTFRARPEDVMVLADEEGAPLVFLRGDALVITFDVRRSNAATWPSFVVMLARHLTNIRDAQIAFERKNLETGQTTSVAVRPSATGVLLVRGSVEQALPIAGRAARFRTPLEPGRFEIVDSDGSVLAEHGARFADVREADLTKAASEDGVASIAGTLAVRARQDDPLTTWWGLGLVALLLATFFATSGRRA